MDYWKFASLMIGMKNDAIGGQPTGVIIEELWYKLKADNEITKDTLLAINMYCIDWAEYHTISNTMVVGVTGNQGILASAVKILSTTLEIILVESVKAKCLYPIYEEE